MFKDKEEIDEKQEKLEELKAIKKAAEKDIKKNHPGYENCKIINVIHYNKPVELVNRKTGKVEEFDLHVALAQDPETEEIWEMYYLDSEEVDFTELMKKYESATPIKDVIDATEKNKELPEEEQDEEYETEELEELEEEKEQEEQEEEKEDKEEEQEFEEEDSLTGKKPKYVIQTIDVNSTYLDNWTTISKGFNLPPEVKQIAIAKPMQEDENVLAADMTMYMLDEAGRVIEDANGKTIDDLFQIDRATGKNPINDENTKLELGGYAERNESHTMRRFNSKENPNLYLSAEQKEIGGYAQVYAGRKTMEGNDAVEVQLETRNVGIQTSLQMQRISAGYKGIYNIEDIDKEVDRHEEHGDDMKNIALENADGKSYTVEICNSQYIPGTEMTWEELSNETGESITKLQERFVKESKDGKEPLEILDEIEYDYGMVEHTRDRM